MSQGKPVELWPPFPAFSGISELPLFEYLFSSLILLSTVCTEHSQAALIFGENKALP